MIHTDYALERKEILQSYIWTMVRCDFSKYEKRILYRLVEMMQPLLSGLKLNRDHRDRIDKRLDEFYEVTMPIAAALGDEEDTNYQQVKNALLSLQKKTVQYEDYEEWKSISLITNPKIRKNEGLMRFKLHEDVYNALMNFTKGYKKYEIQTAMKFESVYTMRFYELFSKQRTPLIYSIQDLKIMFGVEKKYKKTGDFIIKTVNVAQKELDEKSPYSFDHVPMKTGRKITSIKFYPKYIPTNEDQEFYGKELSKQISPSLLLDRPIWLYLRDHYMFATPELKNNAALFQRAQKEIPDLLMFLSEVKAKANRAGNPKGYLINALKRRMKIKTEKKTVKAQAPERLNGGKMTTELFAQVK